MTHDRSIRLALELAASPGAVWEALTTAEGLAAWLAPEAEVVPGEGGRHRVSWGEGMAIEARIATWRPGERLTLVESLPHRGGAELVAEWTIEAAGGATTLRLVHSGFSADASWDDELDAIDRGWRAFLHGLRVALERHAGAPVVHLCALRSVRDPEAAWRALHERLALPAAPTEAPTPRPGRGLDGAPWACVVERVLPGHRLLTVPALGGALIHFELAGAWLTGRALGWAEARPAVSALQAPLVALVDDLAR